MDFVADTMQDDISIHAPRVGRDCTPPPLPPGVAEFQSTRPVWGATLLDAPWMEKQKHFNPRAPCGARRWCTRTGTL